MIKVTLESAIKSAEKGILERGEDYVYQRRNFVGDMVCYYVAADGKSPDCFVGYIMRDHGMSIGDLQDREGQHSHELPYDSGDDLRVDSFLAVLQGWQDEGKTWGEALRRAKEVVGV